ncbi:hypothetical protein DSO57_1027824 [Entomophthora muscae]|uniref:Uncharacterized protein n=1 Tax=Entomophthora muscae TaxID=34485 RepID=A0ACC2UMH6_9FUNG|nr:hypothetical protein DSO57_1027824 [Entomophthora muscae]
MLSISQCVLTSSNLRYARGDVGALTTGLFDAIQPMHLDTKTYWRTDTNFTEHYFKSLKSFVIYPSIKYNSIPTTFQAFYHWEGGIPVSDPIACYEHERCTTTVIWDGKL